MRLIVTGFSVFAGVPDNPTERLARWIQQQQEDGALGGLEQCDALEVAVLEVSAEAVDAWMSQQRQQQQHAGSARAVLVHLGVDSSRQQYSLERVAWNEAHFRVPDQAGHQPQHCRIDDAPGRGTSCALHSSLPLRPLRDALRARGHKAEVSEDAGRFVCNYTLYRSLQMAEDAAASGQPSPPASMFLHIPPFEVIPEEQQRLFLVDLLHELCRLLACAAAGGGGGGE
jgi:pyroglutamyl-peptidase